VLLFPFSRAFSADDDNEIEIAEDDDEDDADLISQGWIVTEADGGTVTSPSEGAPEEEFDLSNDTSFIDAVPPEGDSRNKLRNLYLLTLSLFVISQYA